MENLSKFLKGSISKKCNFQREFHSQNHSKFRYVTFINFLKDFCTRKLHQGFLSAQGPQFLKAKCTHPKIIAWISFCSWWSRKKIKIDLIFPIISFSFRCTWWTFFLQHFIPFWEHHSKSPQKNLGQYIDHARLLTSKSTSGKLTLGSFWR